MLYFIRNLQVHLTKMLKLRKINRGESMTDFEHTHTAPDGTTYAHIHEQPHTHHHEHTQTKAVLNRLSRAIGHLESVKKMVEDDGTAPSADPACRRAFCS
jgi:hypothetical protein